MAEAEEILREALDSSRAKELLLRREAPTISRAAAALVGSLRAGQALYLVGEGAFAEIARYLARVFFEGEGFRPLKAYALADASAFLRGNVPAQNPLCQRQVEAFLGKGDVLLALCLDGFPPPIAAAVARARAKGAHTIAFSGYPANGVQDAAELAVVVPSRKPGIIAEAFVAVGHLLHGLVEKRLGLDEVRGFGPASPSVAPLASDAALDSEDEAETAGAGRGEPRVVLGGVAEPPVARHVSMPPAVADSVAPPEEVHPRLANVAVQAVQVPPPPAGMVRFKCTKCGETITIDGKYAGRRGQCPHCLAEFAIPKPEDVPARRALKVSGLVSRPPQAERRRGQRVWVKDALVSFAKQSWPLEGIGAPPAPLEDLSATGACFQVPEDGPIPLAPGDHVFLALDFPAFVGSVKAKAEVRRVSPWREQGILSVGVRFSKLEGDGPEKVRKLLENQALRGVAKSR